MSPLLQFCKREDINYKRRDTNFKRGDTNFKRLDKKVPKFGPPDQSKESKLDINYKNNNNIFFRACYISQYKLFIHI